MFLRREFFRVNNYFAELGLRPRPLLDPEVLKTAYFRLAAEHHPDGEGGDAEKFRALQVAHRTLRDPASRLRHLGELTFGSAGAGATGRSQEVGLFLEVGALLQEVEAWQKRRAGTRTALARALLQEEGQGLRGRVGAALEAVETRLAESGRELEALDARWPEVAAEELQSLATGWRFLQRWKVALAEAGLLLEAGG